MCLTFTKIIIFFALFTNTETARSIDLNKTPSPSSSDGIEQTNEAQSKSLSHNVINSTPPVQKAEKDCDIHRPGCIHWDTLSERDKNNASSKANYYKQAQSVLAKSRNRYKLLTKEERQKRIKQISNQTKIRKAKNNINKPKKSFIKPRHSETYKYANPSSHKWYINLDEKKLEETRAKRREYSQKYRDNSTPAQRLKHNQQKSKWQKRKREQEKLQSQSQKAKKLKKTIYPSDLEEEEEEEGEGSNGK